MNNAELNREKSIIRSLSKRSNKTALARKRTKLIRDGVEVPFGIRAIESGIEVDGVWVSRNNSHVTLPTSHSSNPNSVHGNMPSSSTTDLSTSDVPHRTDPTSGLQWQPMMSGSRPVSRVMDRSISQDSIINIPSAAEMSQVPGVRYPPHSYSRYENTRHFRKSRATNSSENVSRPVSSHGESRKTII